MKKRCIFLICLFSISGFAPMAFSGEVLYDCAANSLYLFCRLVDKDVSYDKCVELLPLTEEGNSLLEMNNALQKCGFETEVKMIKSDDIPKVKLPSVILHYPKKKADKLGHYFTIIPHDGKITIYDYPADVMTFPSDFLASSLKQNDINEFPIIMCKMKTEAGGVNRCQKTTQMTREIVFKGFEKQLIGEMDFGRLPESSLIRCSFNLTNMSSIPIELNNINADCKCSKIQIDKTYVPPGNSCQITMDVSLVKKYKDVAVKGRGVINQINEAKSTNLMMLIKGYSEPRILCDPQKINLGIIKNDSGLTKYEGVKIFRTKFSKDNAISIKPTASNVNVLNVKENRDSIEFDITLDSNDSVGLQTSKIDIFLDNESEPASYFDIMAIMQLDFAISPKVAIVKKGQKSVVTVTPKEQVFSVERVLIKDKSDYFNVSYSNKANSSFIYISFEGEEEPQQLIEDFVEVIIQLTDTEEEKVLKIPIIYIPVAYS